MYGFYDALSIFSSTLILMLSSAMEDPERKVSSDQDGIGLAWSLLRSMKDDGNVPASDYFDQLKQLKEAIHAACDKLSSKNHGPLTAPLPQAPDDDVEMHPAPGGLRDHQSLSEPHGSSTARPLPPIMITNKDHAYNTDPFNDPFLHGFWSQPNQQQPPLQMPMPVQEQSTWLVAPLNQTFAANGNDQMRWDLDWDSLGML